MKKVNLRYEIITTLLPVLFFYIFCLIMLWFFKRESFWDWLFIGLGIVTVIISLVILLKKLSKKRKEDLVKNINILGLKDDVNNFINRAGNNKDNYAWKHMDYSFNTDKMKVFVKVLKEKGLKIKNQADLEYILKFFIDNKEENIIKGGFSFDKHEFSSLSGMEFENLLVKLFESIDYMYVKIIFGKYYYD